MILKMFKWYLDRWSWGRLLVISFTGVCATKRGRTRRAVRDLWSHTAGTQAQKEVPAPQLPIWRFQYRQMTHEQ